jgi:hypothetical protein
MEDLTDTTTLTEPVRESVLAQRLNIPRQQFKAWREDGVSLLTPLHWWKDEQGAYVLTAAGQERVLEIMQVPTEQAPPPPATVSLVAVCPGAMNRVLRCRSPEGGPQVSVRLTGARVFATLFRRGDRIEATPTETEGIYEYDGTVPRRTRL